MNSVSVRAGSSCSSRVQQARKQGQEKNRLASTYIADAVCPAVFSCATNVNLILSAIPGGRCYSYSQLTAGRTEAWKGQITYKGLSTSQWRATNPKATAVSCLVAKPPSLPSALGRGQGRWCRLLEFLPQGRIGSEIQVVK